MDTAPNLSQLNSGRGRRESAFYPRIKMSRLTCQQQCATKLLAKNRVIFELVTKSMLPVALSSTIIELRHKRARTIATSFR
jgi:hypothetical protein